MNRASEPNISRFTSLYFSCLREWAGELAASNGLILAISRKGPRLIELMVRDGLLPTGFMSRVISEHALPFLRRCPGDMLVIDDSLNHGSTFSRILGQVNQVYKYNHWNDKVLGVPLAVSKEAASIYQQQLHKFFLSLDGAAVAPFVNNEVTAFRLLAKPFDLEHPILTLRGNFSKEKIEAALTQLCVELKGELIFLEKHIPTANKIIEQSAWTILLDGKKVGIGSESEVCKVRLYANESFDLVRIVAIHPHNITNDSLSHLHEVLPNPLRTTFSRVIETVCQDDHNQVKLLTSRSCAMWANFLSTMPLLSRCGSKIFDAFIAQGCSPEWCGLEQIDLSLLVGPDLATEVHYELQEYLQKGSNSSELFGEGWNLPAASDEPHLKDDELIPSAYRERYLEKREKALKLCTDVDDILRAIFYTQHTEIELPSRNSDVGAAENRLEFGITFRRLQQMVCSRVPSATHYDIHRCLDRLIDDGGVVPRYINIASNRASPVWARTFRVGEGPVEKVSQMVLFFIECIRERLGATEVPSELLEKFCVLIMSAAENKSSLATIRMPEIAKVFYLYGARLTFETGQQKPFLLDWAVNHKLIRRVAGGYIVDEGARECYPVNENQLDDETKDAIADLGSLVVNISKAEGLHDKALVTITSVASRLEFHKAVEAELSLWLHHTKWSIYDSINALVKFAQESRDERTFNDAKLKSLNNDYLVPVSNVTRQGAIKKNLWDGRETVYAEIDKSVSENELTRRAWRDMRKALDSRYLSEGVSSGCEQILSALKIAHGTNRLLRGALALTGYQDSQKRDKPLPSFFESLEALKILLSDRSKVDDSVAAVFRSTDPSRNVESMIAKLEEEANNKSTSKFWHVIEKLRPLVQTIASNCENVLHDYGTSRTREQSEILTPPKFLLMWDIRNSSSDNEHERSKLADAIAIVNSRIISALGPRARNFQPGLDDGNGLICDSFTDILAAFKILSEGLVGYVFRAGCEVNLQGNLIYYARLKNLNGRAFDHAARVMTLFKEVQADHGRWNGEGLPDEPKPSYLVVGEFARRFVENNCSWPPEGYETVNLDGKYSPRVFAALPISVSILLIK